MAPRVTWPYVICSESCKLGKGLKPAGTPKILSSLSFQCNLALENTQGRQYGWCAKRKVPRLQAEYALRYLLLDQKGCEAPKPHFVD